MKVEGDRVTQTAGLFDRSASYYDGVNSVICLGMDKLWRRWAAGRALSAAAEVRAAEARPLRLLDAFGGTGLVALELARRGAAVTLADVSPGMLAVARQRVWRRGLAVEVVQADLGARSASELPGAPFDAVTVAFGLRYAADPAASLRGLAAALAPGGSLVLLEAVVAHGGPVAAVAGAYFFEVAPRVGTLLAGRSELYDQLTATVRSLGGAAELLGHVRAAGLAPRERRLFAGGVVAGIVAVPASTPVALSQGRSASGMFSLPTGA